MYQANSRIFLASLESIPQIPNRSNWKHLKTITKSIPSLAAHPCMKDSSFSIFKPWKTQPLSWFNSLLQNIKWIYQLLWNIPYLPMTTQAREDKTLSFDAVLHRECQIFFVVELSDLGTHWPQSRNCSRFNAWLWLEQISDLRSS